MPSKSWVILLSHFWVFLQRVSKWEVDFRKCEGPPGWRMDAQLTALPVGCSKADRSWVKVLFLILLWISSVGVVWMTSSVIGNLTWLIVSFCAEKWKDILVKYSSGTTSPWAHSHRHKKIPPTFLKNKPWPSFLASWRKEMNIISLLTCEL